MRISLPRYHLLLGAVILSILILSGFGCNKKTEIKTATEAAKEEFEKMSYKNLSKDKLQLFVDIAAGEKGWNFFYEELNYNQTRHFEFPLTAVRTQYLNNESKKGEFIIVEQLFIFDYERIEWLPISYTNQHFKDNKLLKEELDDLWSQGNDWAEIYKKSGTSSHAFPNNFIEESSSTSIFGRYEDL